MNALVELRIPSLEMQEEELIKVLQESVYPGAAMASIKLAIGYCRAQVLDPLQKPVHIVPMSVKVGKKPNSDDDKYEMRDVIMPGIGLYRIQAARTGQYAGISEPEFGPELEYEFEEEVWVDGDNGSRRKTKRPSKIKYPDWCRVTVRRLVDEHVVEFTAVEFWTENYATAGRWTTAPNAMWKKRPRGQLAKCAEAQALRKAFPEIGAQPTAEEMEGKSIDEDVIEGQAVRQTAIEGPKSKSEPATQPAGEPASTPLGAESQPAGDAGSDDKPLTAGAIKTLQGVMARAGRTEADLAVAGFPAIEKMKFEQHFNKAMTWLKEHPAI